MKVLVLYVMTVIDVHCVSTVSTINAVNKAPLCSCWSATLSYLNNMLNANITLQNCLILPNNVTFEMDALLNGSKGYSLEKLINCSCSPKQKKLCSCGKKLWFPKQEWIFVAIQIKPTCFIQCHCRPVLIEWMEWHAEPDRPKSQINPTDTPELAPVKEDIFITVGIIVFLGTVVMLIVIMHRKRQRNRHSYSNSMHSNNESLLNNELREMTGV